MLAILTTHPIQYQTPLWQALARDGRVPFEVWYLTGHAAVPSLDREFGRAFAWDIDLLSGYPHRRLLTAGRATPASFWKCRLRERLRDRLASSGAKALWMQGWQVGAYWQAAREARAAGVELWLRGESNGLAPRPWWKREVRRTAQSRLFRGVDRFLYIGSANRALYESYGAPARRLYHAPYAVDNERFARQASALLPRRGEIRREWGIPEDAFCALFCGKFIAKKRPLDLAAAARLLRVNGIAAPHLLFAGSGPLEAEIRRACPSDASFTGFLNQTEISKAYVAADCLVLPSDYGETWGLVVNEALASGLPCLVSDACGSAQDLIPPARRFRMGNVSELAAKLAVEAHAPDGLPRNARDFAIRAGREPAPRGRQPAREPGAGLPSISDTVASVVRAYGDMSADRAACVSRSEAG